MRDALAAIDAEIVDPARVSSMFPGRALDSSEVTDWLNKIEQIAPLVIYLGSRRSAGLDPQGHPPGRHGRVRMHGKAPSPVC